MTMKKKLAIVLCSMPLAVAPIAYAQTGGSTEGTTSPQSGTQTDMGEDGASNSGSKNDRAGANGASSGNTSGAASGNTSGTASGNTNSAASGSASGAATSGSAAGTGRTGGDGTATGASGSTGATSGATGATGATGTTGSDSKTGASNGGSSSPTSNASSTNTGAASAPNASASAGDSFEANLKGKSVHNENDEKVGDVKDVVLSSDGKVTHVVLGVGGFVGVGEHLVAIPYNEINTSGDKLTLRGHTKEQLKEMPAYERPRETPARTPGSSAPAAPMGATR